MIASHHNKYKCLSFWELMRKVWSQSLEYLEEAMRGTPGVKKVLWVSSEKYTQPSCEFPSCSKLAFAKVLYGKTNKGFYTCCEHQEEFEKPRLMFIGFLR